MSWSSSLVYTLIWSFQVTRKGDCSPTEVQDERTLPVVGVWECESRLGCAGYRVSDLLWLRVGLPRVCPTSIFGDRSHVKSSLTVGVRVV